MLCGPCFLLRLLVDVKLIEVNVRLLLVKDDQTYIINFIVFLQLVSREVFMKSLLVLLMPVVLKEMVITTNRHAAEVLDSPGGRSR